MRSARLGQHFLASEVVLRKLVSFVPPPPMKVLEIGTGDGRLTEKLLDEGYEVTGYELDEGLYEKARGLLGGRDRLKLVRGDGFADASYYDVLVASLPYYASRRFVEWFSSVSTPLGVVILQKDFVDKIASRPGGRKYGAYSVLTEFCFEEELLFVIPPQDFEPRPRVYSAALKLRRLRMLYGSDARALKLKSLFGYRGRLVSRYVKDFRKRRLVDESAEIPEGILEKRVEDLTADEAMRLIQWVK